jgi:hypothetical protein
MAAKNGMEWRLARSVIGAAMLVVALPMPGRAQQSDPAKRSAKTVQSVTTYPASKQAKPIVRIGTAKRAKTPEVEGRPWTLQDAMPDHSASMRQFDPRPPSPAIGRLPLQSGPGTVGFETKTQVNPNQTPDGATIRGQETTAARSSTYLGMSLSVPTGDKAMNFPIPWARP